MAAAHSATAAARWKQRGGCGRFTGTVCKCANAHVFERHQRADVHVFIIGRGQRDDSADGIVVVGSDGGARGDIHCSRQCAAAAAPEDDAANDDTTDADGEGDADDIVCETKLNLIYRNCACSQ